MSKPRNTSTPSCSIAFRQALFFGKEYLAKTQEIFGSDPFPYGVKANRKLLETLVELSFEQGLITKKPKIEELFAESTRDL